MLSDRDPSGDRCGSENFTARDRLPEAAMRKQETASRGQPEGRQHLADRILPKSPKLIALPKPLTLPATEKKC